MNIEVFDWKAERAIALAIAIHAISGGSSVSPRPFWQLLQFQEKTTCMQQCICLEFPRLLCVCSPATEQGLCLRSQQCALMCVSPHVSCLDLGRHGQAGWALRKRAKTMSVESNGKSGNCCTVCVCLTSVQLLGIVRFQMFWYDIAIADATLITQNLENMFF